MRWKCLLGLHSYKQTWETDILKCKYCGIIKRKGYFIGIKIGR